MSYISGIMTALCVLIGMLAVPISIVVGATRGGLTAGGLLAALLTFAICEIVAVIGFIVFGGLTAIRSLRQ